MRVSLLKRSAIVGLLVTGAACARNNSDDAEIGAARDSTAVTSDSGSSNQPGSRINSDSVSSSQTGSGVTSDSAGSNRTGARVTSDSATGNQSGSAVTSDSASSNQTESGVTDSSGRSTLGPGAQQTRPDQGQPVTSKGDTVNTGVDSSTTPR
jgi:hypothetical protein